MKNNNSTKKFLSIIFSAIFMVSGVFLCSCTKYSKGKFCEENAEWVSDELTIKTEGYSSVAFGYLTEDDEQTEVIAIIAISKKQMAIYRVNDFDFEFIKSINEGIASGKYKDSDNNYALYSEIWNYIMTNKTEYIFNYHYSYKGGSVERLELEVRDDKEAKKNNTESRFGETCVLTRHDLPQE